jgi:hypothetical protein
MVREDRPRPERVLTPVTRLQSRLNQPRDLLVPQPAVTVAGVQFLFQSLGDPTTQRCIIAAFRLIRCLFLSLDRLELIRSRKGTTHELRPEPPPTTAPKAEYPDFAARRRALKMPMMTKAQREQLDKLIAGE